MSTYTPSRKISLIKGLTLFFSVVGLVVGVFLVSQNQDIRRRAQTAGDITTVKQNIATFHAVGAEPQPYPEIKKSLLNPSFESGTTSWTRSGDIGPNDFYAVDCNVFGPCRDGRYYLKIARLDDGVPPLDPHVVSGWIEIGQNVSGRTFTLTFSGLNHNNPQNTNPKTITGIAIQRYPLGGDWSQTIADIGPIDVTTTWQTFSRTVTFPTPANGNTSSQIRVILRTPSDNWPVYYDALTLTQVTPPNSDGSWSDVNYANEAGLSTHFARTRFIAQKAAQTSDPALISQVNNALNYAYSYVYPGVNRTGNWWFWDFGMPLSIGITLITLEGSLNQTTFNNSLSTLNYLVNTPFFGTPITGGQNGVWRAHTVLYQGLLNNDITRVNQAKQLLEQRLALVSLLDGLQSDHSFLMHDLQLYNGGYGSSYAIDVAKYINWTSATGFQLNQSSINNHIDYLLDGLRWSTYQIYKDPSTVSRGTVIESQETKEQSLLHALLMDAQLNHSRHDEVVATAKQILLTWGAVNPLYSQFVPLVQNSPIPPQATVGHRHYPYSDFTIHRTANSYTSVRMRSNRIQVGENGARTVWHAGDGYTYIALDDKKYWQDNIRPTQNWYRLSGTTVERKTRSYCEGYACFDPTQNAYVGGYGNTSFVGGTFHGNFGVSAQDLDASNSCLTAKKSWFFFDDEVVALGSNINCPSSANIVETIVNQWPLSYSSMPLVVNGVDKPTNLGWSETMSGVNWAHLDNIGYFFPGGSTIKGERTIQSGSWVDISFENTNSLTHYNPFLTLWFDHGSNPGNSSYRYVLLPNKSASQTQIYAGSNPLAVLSNNNISHAVKDNQLNAVGVVFWQAGTLDLVSVDRPSIVFYQTIGNNFKFSLSEPTHQNQVVTATVNLSLTPVSIPSGVTVTPGPNQTTIITVNAQNGSNYALDFSIGTQSSPTPTPSPSPSPSPTVAPSPSPIPGDANGDGKVDGLDFIIWLNHFGQSGVSGVSEGDFNLDKSVDGLDYIFWLANFSPG